MKAIIKINKREFYDLGGVQNSKIFRKQTSRGWKYFKTF
jgi:hypothetical protein